VLVGDGFDTTTSRLETRSTEAVVVNLVYQEIWYKSNINAKHTGMIMRLDSRCGSDDDDDDRGRGGGRCCEKPNLGLVTMPSKVEPEAAVAACALLRRLIDLGLWC
jgi:hypothetical protein